MFYKYLNRRISTIIIIVFVLMNHISSVNAAIVTMTELVTVKDTQIFSQDSRVILQRKILQEELVMMGVDSDMAFYRIDSLSDNEINEFVVALNNQKAGGNPLIVIGVLVLFAGLFYWYLIENIQIGSGF